MRPPKPTTTEPLHPLAKACLAAPILALGLSLLFSILRADEANVVTGAVRILLLMVGFTLAFVALFGSRGPGRERLARYGLAGLIINGIYLFASAVMFPGTLAQSRVQSAHHRLHAMSVSAREVSPGSAHNAAIINYTNLDWSRPGQALDALVSAARDRTGEDAAVLRAWSGVLTQLLAARLEVQLTAEALALADVLNPATITNASRTAFGDQFIARRLLANRYGSALHRWEHTLTCIGQTYANELKQLSIATERAALEDQRLAAITGLRIKPLIQLCVAEQNVAAQYGRAISAMESCHPFNGLSNSEEAPHIEAKPRDRELAEQLAKLDRAKRIASDLQQKLAEAGQGQGAPNWPAPTRASRRGSEVSAVDGYEEAAPVEAKGKTPTNP